MLRKLRSAAVLAALVGASLVVPQTAALAVDPPPVLQLYFLSDQNGDGYYGIYRAAADGSGRVPFVAETKGVFLDSAVVSPDGRRVVYLRYPENKPVTVHVINADGVGDHVVDTFVKESYTDLHWLPDSQQIIYNDLNAQRYVRVRDVDTVAATHLLPSSSALLGPYVSPYDPTRVYGHMFNGPLMSMPLDGHAKATVYQVANPTPDHVQGGTMDAYKGIIVSIPRYGTVDARDLTVVYDKAPYPFLNGGDSPIRPFVAPDGKTVLMDRYADKAHGYIGDLWSASVDGGAPTRLSNTPTIDEYQLTGGYADTTAPTGSISAVAAVLNGARPQLSWTRTSADIDGVETVVCRKPGAVAPASFAECGTPVYRGTATKFLDTVTPNATYSYALFLADRSGNVDLTATPPTLTLQALNRIVITNGDPTSRDAAAPPFPVSWSSPGAPAGQTYSISWALLDPRAADQTLHPWFTDSTVTSSVFGAAGEPAAPKEGDAYFFKATTQDVYGNPVGTSVTRSDIPFDQTHAGYTTGWHVPKAGGRWGGSVTTTGTPNAYATMVVSGPGFFLVGDRCPKCGQIRLYRNDKLVATLDTYARSYQIRQVLYSTSAPGSWRWKVVVVGTQGRPNVDLDAFGVYGKPINPIT